jgi:hypothetical protein
MIEDPALLLRFTPARFARIRAGGWTAERQIAFIAALSRTGVVKAAADSVGMSARSAYQLRTRVLKTANRLVDVQMAPEDLALFGAGFTYSFAHAWDLALRHGLGLQIEGALPVALEKDREPIIRRGRILGWREKFNARLAINALGAWRRHNEGAAYDHEWRIEERTHHLAVALEAMYEKGPAHWPDPPAPGAVPPDPPPDAASPDPPDGIGPEGLRLHGLLDPYGPADRPPRSAAEQGYPSPLPRARRRRES